MSDIGQHGSIEELHIADGDQGVEVAGPRGESADTWTETLNKVVNCVVVLKVTQTRAFDTESAGSSYATGFIVDKQLGLILTNRHVVTPGPIKAEAVFQNREEIPVYPLYYDPVHDFGFMRFDPSKLRFMQLGEIPLAPEAAAVGMDIRVVGNDSGEKISILSGTLARLDRDAPHYGKKTYNDFNTFYMQAASGTKGGSSGSPVIDIHGRAVGLNAGGKNKAASAYYLPLHRIVRALHELQRCALPDGTWSVPVISRGDLQATFLFKGFDEVKRLGLREDTEAAVRDAQQAHSAQGVLAGRSTGMLIVDSVVPGGVAEGHLEPGDIVVRLNGAYVSHFLPLEAALDAKVGELVELEVERGGKTIVTSLKVQDLHAVTPSTFIELGGGIVNALSYQQARNNRGKTGEVYCAEPGYLLAKAGVPRLAIIKSVAGHPTDDLPSFIASLKTLQHGQRVPIQFFTFAERFRVKNVILHVDWNWYGPPVQWTRDCALGVWHPEQIWTSEMAPHAATAFEAALEAQANGSADAPGNAGDGDGAVSPRICSPRIQASVARGGGGGNEVSMVPAPASIPRKHSVADIPGSNELEKSMGGVTCLTDDARLQAPGLNDTASAGVAEVNGVNGLHVQEREAWRVDLEKTLRCALVNVDVEIPLVTLPDGVHSRTFGGCGVIVHHSDRIGLVLVDRNTVVVGPGDITLAFGAFPAEVPAKVRFLHPWHNFSIVSYDPKELSPEARRLIKSVRLEPEPALQRGDDVELVCLSKSLRIVHRTSTVLNPAMSVIIGRAEVPRFRAVHEEVVKVDQDFGIAYSGVLASRAGGVRALWASFSEQVDKEEREWNAGLPAAAFAPWVEELIARLDPAPAGSGEGEAKVKGPPSVYTLDAELEPLLLSKAAQFGLPVEWVNKLVHLDQERRQVLRVRSCVAGSHAQQVLKDGDMVLSVAGHPVSAFSDLQRIIASFNVFTKKKTSAANGVTTTTVTAMDIEPSTEITAVGSTKRKVHEGGAAMESKRLKAANGHSPATDQPPPEVPVVLYRDGRVMEVGVRLGKEDGLGTNRLVHWSGAQLQEPHRGVRELGFMPDCHGVYVSRWHHGSPAHRYGMYALHWITEVNGEPVKDLDGFLEAVKSLEDGADVRLRMVHFSTAKAKVMTLKMDTRYWPTWELSLDAEGAEWTRRTLQ